MPTAGRADCGIPDNRGMSDTNHLLVPCAASTADGCRQALPQLALPNLGKLLARLGPEPAKGGDGAGHNPGGRGSNADVEAETSFSTPHERALARALGLPAQDGRIPWAAWHRHQQGEPDAATGGWAFITPCQWQVSTDHVTLRDPAQLGLDDAASRALLAIVAPWFAEDGITLRHEDGQPTRWLAHGALFADLATASLERVLLRDVRAWMPDAAAARTLHRLHSEMQMLLYTHAFNDERAARSLPVVNAFWVHGTGALPSPAPAATTAPPTMPLALRDAALREDWPAWAAAWRVLDAGPVADLLRRAEAGAPVRLTLCGERRALAFGSGAARHALVRRIQSIFKPRRFLDIADQL